MTERIKVNVVSGIIRHPVTLNKIEDGDEVDFSPAIARLINSGQLEVVAVKSSAKAQKVEG